MKQRIKKYVAYGFVVATMICAISWVTLFASLENKPGKLTLFLVALGVVLNTIPLLVTLAITEDIIGKNNVRTIVWCMFLFILTAVLYHLLLAPYNHAYFDY